MVIVREKLRKKPYRGIYAAIAAEKGVSQMRVMRAIWEHGIPEYIEVLLRHIEEIDAAEGRTAEGKLVHGNVIVIDRKRVA